MQSIFQVVRNISGCFENQPVGKHLKMKNDFFFQLKTLIGSYPRPEGWKILFQDNFDRTEHIFFARKTRYIWLDFSTCRRKNMLPQIYEVYRLVMDQATKIWVLSFGSKTKQGLCKVFCYIFGIIFEDFLKWSTLKLLQNCEIFWQKIGENGSFDWSLPSTDYTIT